MITRDAALEIAKSHAAERGWPWVEPIHVNAGARIHVMTNADHRGGNVNVWIDASDGRILSSGFAKR